NASSPVGRGTRQTGTPVPAVTVPTRDRDLLGYKIYRDNVLIQTINSPTTLAFDDMDLAVGTYSYTVTAYYTGGESTPAGPVTAQIYPPNNPPTDVTATVEGNDVTINWESPEAPPTGQWITWCQDVLGNSIGTNAAVTFDVAHRFTQADLAAVAGGTISQVKFVPAHEACVYTVKVWTGGSATNAGTLVSSQVVTAPIIDAWNIAVLNTPVPIPSTGDVYIGFEVNTQGGYPAGCDSGPHIEGKGNMMYFQGAWTTLTALAPTLTYNWLVQTFVSTSTGMKQLELKPIVEAPRPSYPKAELAVYHKDIETRPVTGFKIYRDGVLLTTINDPLATTYTDMDLPNGTYTYGVTALHTGGESVPATVQVTVNVQLAEIVFQDGFETYENFANLFAPWTLLDVDLSTTYGITGIDFPGSAAQMAYIIFNPSATTPPITTLAAHGGAKMAASFAATTPPNNDFLITPRVQLGTSSAIKFYAKSHTAQYGLERFRVGVSLLPTILPQGFQWINGEYTEAPIAWTEYVFDLSAYDNQTVRVALRCVSNDAVVFYVDDFSLHSNGGIIVDNDDPTIPTIGTRLQGNYPNPFNPETTIRFSVKEATPVTIEIYNTKGQLVKTLINEAKEAGNHSVVWNGKDNSGRSVSSGVYFYKMNAGKYSSTKKMIMMK
ncbi:MAG TPA: choice-of-anchor J domain-containing protein, partial [Candidatus Cloacimonadota bacterium]|nr:choice-of-anchor J domain-containing protein [Candidatus Cloacimonadota bacterium]